MKTKPWSLVVLALLHVLAPFGNLYLNSLRMGRTFDEHWHYWFEIIPKFLLALYIGLPVLAGISIYLCRRWSYWAYLVCIGFILLSNIFSYWTNMTLVTLLCLIFAAVIDILVVAYFMVPSVQKIYFDPRLRWWEAAPRFNFNIAGTLNGVSAHLKNLSQGGLFVTDGPSLNEGDQVQISWDFEGQRTQVSGKVLYKGPQRGVLGYGIRFEHTPESQKSVKQVVEKLQSRKLIVIERLPGPEDGFLVWLKKLVTTGEGLFPKFRV